MKKKKSNKQPKKSILPEQPIEADVDLAFLTERLMFSQMYQSSSESQSVSDITQTSMIISINMVELILDIAYKRLQEDFMLKEIPLSSCHYVAALCFNLTQMEIMNDDQINIKSMLESEDREPENKLIEKWKSYDIIIKQKVEKKIDSPELLLQSALNKMTKTTSRFLFKSNVTAKLIPSESQNQSQMSKMLLAAKAIKEVQVQEDMSNVNKPLEPNQEDVLENGLRLAYERDIIQRQQQQIQEIQREKEAKLQQIQMQKMNDKQKNKKLTFDYDGKIVIQAAPNQNKLPSSLYYSPSFGITLEKVTGSKEGPLKANFKEKVKQKEKEEKRDIDTVSPFKDQQKQPLVVQSNSDQFVLNKGVSLRIDQVRRMGPSLHNDEILSMDNRQINDSLTNPNLNLRLTREEYQLIVKNTSQHQQQALLQTMNGENEQKQVAQQAYSIGLPQKQPYFLQMQRAKDDQIKKQQTKSGLIRLGDLGSLEKITRSDQSLLEQELSTHRQRIAAEKSSQNIFHTPSEEFQMGILTNRDWGTQKERNESRLSRRPPNLRQSHQQTLPYIQAKSPREKYELVSKNVDKYGRVSDGLSKYFGSTLRSLHLGRYEF